MGEEVLYPGIISDIQTKCLAQGVIVNSEIFGRTLFSRIALNDIFATLKIATRASVNGIVFSPFREGFKENPLENFQIYSIFSIKEAVIYVSIYICACIIINYLNIFTCRMRSAPKCYFVHCPPIVEP